MKYSANGRYEKAPRFRPPLSGCVAKDLTLCRMLGGVWSDTLSSLKYNLDASLLSLSSDRAMGELLYKDAEEMLEQLRVLGELMLALGADALPRGKGLWRCGGKDDALLCRVTGEKRRRIDVYETLMSQTGDRVVRSVISGLISSERRCAARLEGGNSSCEECDKEEKDCE